MMVGTGSFPENPMSLSPSAAKAVPLGMAAQLQRFLGSMEELLG